MVWLIIFAVLCVLPFVPLGFRATYREKDPGVWLLIGPFKFRVYPSSKKTETKKSKPHSKIKLPETGGGYHDFVPVARAVLDFLGQFRRKIRVKNLEFKITLAGDDPCDLALNYGRAWAAVGTLTPQLERLFVIKRRNLAVDCDFNGDKTRVYANVVVTITMGRTIHLLSKHGIKIIKELLELKKLQKGGAQI